LGGQVVGAYQNDIVCRRGGDAACAGETAQAYAA
jgi:hypothetical protein